MLKEEDVEIITAYDATAPPTEFEAQLKVKPGESGSKPLPVAGKESIGCPGGVVMVVKVQTDDHPPPVLPGPV